MSLSFIGINILLGFGLGEIIVTGFKFLRYGFQYNLISGQNTLRTVPFAFLYLHLSYISEYI